MDELSKKICIYLYRNWIETYKSQRSFAIDHGIEESMVRKIKNTALNVKNTDYNIPVNTLNKICEAKNIKLSDFFLLIDN